MKISLIILILITLITSANAQTKKYKIGVFFWHESSNDYLTFDGVKKGFRIAGTYCEYDIQKAFGSEENANKIINKWIKHKPDLIYAMGTVATRKLMNRIKDTPIVFTAVTNPVQSNLTPNWKTSGRNIAGNSNWIPTKILLKDFKAVVPTLSRLGVMYNPDNLVSSMEIKNARKIEASMGIKLIPVKVKTINDLADATKSLVKRNIDAVWIPIDILIYKNVARIRVVTDPLQIPLVASSHKGVKDGAIFGTIANYHILGQRSVSIALKILTKNLAPKDIPIGTILTHKHIFNLKVALEIGYNIPLSVLATADEIIK